MDIKEAEMLAHYKYIIENRLFDEYDIYSFLILIRDHIPNGSFQIFKEYADAVAHRKKDKGMIIDNIKLCINNNYETKDGKVIKGYKSFSIKSWNTQLKELLKYFNIVSDKKIIKEITLCIFSLFQELRFVDVNNQNVGKLVLFVNPDRNQIDLCTSEGTTNSLMVCFAKLDNVEIKQKLIEVFDNLPAEAIRENGILKLKNKKGIICEIK